MNCSFPKDLQNEVDQVLGDWQSNSKVGRLWNRDASLWTGADEHKWVGWLDICEQQLAQLAQFREVAEDVKAQGYDHVVLLGMGGSSLCPEVLALSFGRQPGFPQMLVLDSTDPSQVRTLDSKIDPKKTLFIVSSKSGSTLEPNNFKQYFYERAGKDGSRFYAVTDPGSKMQQVAERDKFRRIFAGVPSIGGRYSALSNFGMIPAAAMGIDTAKFLTEAKVMVDACRNPTMVDNPGACLGAVLGALARKGHDKLTIVASPGIHDLGAWLEQLVAESTGKNGKGIIPVDREPIGPPKTYGADRVFVYLRLESAPEAFQDRAIQALEAAGQPVIRIGVRDAYQLGAEFFRWEIATAVAGAVMGINPFDQPDVEASKIATRKLTDEFERTGSLPSEAPAFEEDGIKVFGAAMGSTLADCLRIHLASCGEGDYFGLLAYIEMNDAHETVLQRMRTLILHKHRVATCLGFGPRFLHSTGQAYKGGPNTGVFLQITADDAQDLPVPEQTYSFGIVKAAQARGDFEVLIERKRRALRVHLGKDVAKGLDILASAFELAELDPKSGNA